ncbi:hypothetical protein [Maribacter sp. 2308TA10-17]|uniref:hypothetical protein n=1 Tax=Maribacter sp. 2308TA10-17 TaxID=3386276 RepID=UPI0039BC6FE4
MKFLKITFLISIIIFLNSCASSYQTINPSNLNYKSRVVSNEVILEYKYDLLDKKYEKKETKKNVRFVALKITNNSDRDLTFGTDIKLAYDNNSAVNIMTNNQTFKSLKQSPATHLLYLLLAPVNLYTTKTTNRGIEQKSTPIGLVIGPGLAAGNMIAAGSANKKFKDDVFQKSIDGVVIERGKTASGLIGIRSNSYDALKLLFEGDQTAKSSITKDTIDHEE